MGNIFWNPAGILGKCHLHQIRAFHYGATIRWTALLFLLASVSSCKKEVNEAIDPDLSSPYILSAELSNVSLNFDTSTSPSITKLTDGRYRISDSLFLHAIDPLDAKNVSECNFRVYRPGTREFFLTKKMSLVFASGNEASFAAGISFTAERSDIGQYQIELWAKGTSGFESNHLFLSLFLTRNNARPTLANLFVPDTLKRPLHGSTNVFFAVTAHDSDGLADIQKVFFRSVNSTTPSFEQPMFDDGNRPVTGDSVALDGRFSRLIPLDSSATLGTKEFRFWARDKSGTLSDSLIHVLVIIP